MWTSAPGHWRSHGRLWLRSDALRRVVLGVPPKHTDPRDSRSLRRASSCPDAPARRGLTMAVWSDVRPDAPGCPDLRGHHATR
jgi:hypothetical protein